MDAREFEWESQLRFYWLQEQDDLFVHQCSASFSYGYEYMGLNGRLVITPLTDRIYLTITQVRWSRCFSSQKHKHKLSAKRSCAMRYFYWTVVMCV